MFRIFSVGPKGERVDFRATVMGAVQLIAELDSAPQNIVRVQNPSGRSVCAEHIATFIEQPYGSDARSRSCQHCR